MTAPHLIAMIGVSGGGKTSVGKSLAKQLGWKFYSTYDFQLPENIAKMASEIPSDDSDRVP